MKLKTLMDIKKISEGEFYKDISSEDVKEEVKEWLKENIPKHALREEWKLHGFDEEEL